VLLADMEVALLIGVGQGLLDSLKVIMSVLGNQGNIRCLVEVVLLGIGVCLVFVMGVVLISD
jgi:hypothetical protein